MHSINTRGTFLTSQKVLPHLLESQHPHVLNISPPLNMEAKWFGGHVAYTSALAQRGAVAAGRPPAPPPLPAPQWPSTA